MKSWLFAFLVVLAVALGAMFFTILQHITKAGWSGRSGGSPRASRPTCRGRSLRADLRARRHRQGRAPLPLGRLRDRLHDYLIKKKASYLNVTFWCIRAVVFFTIWAVIARFYFRLSRAGCHRRLPDHQHHAVVAPLAMILYAEPDLRVLRLDHVVHSAVSTMLGVYFFAVSVTGFFSCVLVLVHSPAVKGPRGHHPRALPRPGQMLAFGVVWAYIGFSQYMIWYANIPIETSWFFPALFVVLGVPYPDLGHFAALPPPGLPVAEASGADRPDRGLDVLMLCVDVYWLVIPTVPEVAPPKPRPRSIGRRSPLPASAGSSTSSISCCR